MWSCCKSRIMNYSLFSAVSVWINFWMAKPAFGHCVPSGNLDLNFLVSPSVLLWYEGVGFCHSFSFPILSQSVIHYQRSDLVFYQSSNHSLVTPTFVWRDRGDLIRSIKQPKWRLLETILLKTSLKTYALMLWLFYQQEDVVWEWILRFLSRYIIDLYQKRCF